MSESLFKQRQPFFLWLDLEMTGLNSETDRILEAAVVVTNHAWEEVEVWETAVVQPPEVLAGMNAWCQEHHRESGLLDRVPDGISEADLDQRLADLLARRWQGIPAILCGNSIHQDRKFIDRWLPAFARGLHYRMLDVSSFKVAFQEFLGEAYQKRGTHLALADIRESMAEFRHYWSKLSLATSNQPPQ